MWSHSRATPGEEARLAEAAADGLRMFEQLFGYRSRTFIAPCYTWPASLEKRSAPKESRPCRG